MDERDKLTHVMDKLGNEQLRLLTRFAEIMAEQQKADPMYDTGDIRVRYAEFKRWCDANSLDLAAVDAWVRETRQANDRAAAPRST